MGHSAFKCDKLAPHLDRLKMILFLYIPNAGVYVKNNPCAATINMMCMWIVDDVTGMSQTHPSYPQAE